MESSGRGDYVISVVKKAQHTLQLLLGQLQDACEREGVRIELFTLYSFTRLSRSILDQFTSIRLSIRLLSHSNSLSHPFAGRHE